MPMPMPGRKATSNRLTSPFETATSAVPTWPMIQNSAVIPAANMNCCSAEGSARRAIVNIVAAPGMARRKPAWRACLNPRYM